MKGVMLGIDKKSLRDVLEGQWAGLGNCLDEGEGERGVEDAGQAAPGEWRRRLTTKDQERPVEPGKDELQRLPFFPRIHERQCWP